MKTVELDGVSPAGMGQAPPEHPQDGLRDADRPHGTVEVAPLVALALSGRLHPRQQSERPQHPDRDDDRKVGRVVHLAKPPGACERPQSQGRRC